MESTMVIYGLVPSDLPSLREPNGSARSRGGKAVAHGFHAGNQLFKYLAEPDVKRYIAEGVDGGADHFNTCITLDATVDEIKVVVDMAHALGYVADIVVDPTYPSFMDVEAAKFFTGDNIQVQWDTVKNGKVLVLRNQLTMGWLLGDMTDAVFKGLVKQFKWAE